MTQTVVLSGALALCVDAGVRVAGPQDGAWCVEGGYAGDLASWADPEGLVVDYDGDCSDELMYDELNGLAEQGAAVEATVEQTLIAGEIVETATLGFVVVDQPVCEDDSEAKPKAD